MANEEEQLQRQLSGDYDADDDSNNSSFDDNSFGVECEEQLSYRDRRLRQTKSLLFA